MFEAIIAITALMMSIIILFGLVYDSWHGTDPFAGKDRSAHRDKGSDDD